MSIREEDFDDVARTVTITVSMIEHHLEGSVADAIAYLEQFRAHPGAQISRYEGYDDSWLQIRWTRPLHPEEIATRERDRREAEAKRNTDAYNKERAEYERLKAKFGDK